MVQAQQSGDVVRAKESVGECAECFVVSVFDCLKYCELKTRACETCRLDEQGEHTSWTSCSVIAALFN